MKETVTAIFDIGKTNKKLILFNEDLKVISETEQRFPEIKDDDDFECDDIEHIEEWIKESVALLVKSDKYDLKAVNFSTYGATLVYLDENGKRITPVYNYLKPVDERIPEKIYKMYGGRDEFCRRTASPALGMLNSGIQALWLKSVKPEIFSKVKHVLHFPQYLSYLFTGKFTAEHTSIGCHTALWDFDNMDYHRWVETLGISLPSPVPIDTLYDVSIDGKVIKVGIGIHDSSASLAPYFGSSNGKFLLLSTGTWCINMNPFNDEKLSAEQLDKDCLCYMSIERQPVKSSRLFLGHLHESAVAQITEHFHTSEDSYKKVKPDKKLFDILKGKYRNKNVFFKEGVESRELKNYIDMFEFDSLEKAYHQLMIELCDLTIEAVLLVLSANDDTKNIYITGGFSKNKLFVDLISKSFSDKDVYTSEIANASALGAAFVIAGKKPQLNLGLSKIKS